MTDIKRPWLEPTVRFVVCEVKAQMCANDGDIICDGNFRTEEAAETGGKKYGFHGDNYFVKRIVTPYKGSTKKWK